MNSSKPPFKREGRCQQDCTVFFGGGGHKKAAGFTMTGTPFDVLNNLSKQIEAQMENWKRHRSSKTMIHGIINVYKEIGFTSHDVVAKLRGIVGQKKNRTHRNT